MSDFSMEDPVADGKLVELTYQVIDSKSKNVLTAAELTGKLPGDVIEVPIDCDELFGPRDESLVVVDHIDNVPDEYREIGTSILMENDQGDTKTFIVTRVDDKSVTIDGNNPLCGREVIFKLNIVTVRDATEEELAQGGPLGADNGVIKTPVVAFLT